VFRVDEGFTNSLNVLAEFDALGSSPTPRRAGRWPGRAVHPATPSVLIQLDDRRVSNRDSEHGAHAEVVARREEGDRDQRAARHTVGDLHDNRRTIYGRDNAYGKAHGAASLGTVAVASATLQTTNIALRLAALRGGATGPSLSGLSLKLGGESLSLGLAVLDLHVLVLLRVDEELLRALLVLEAGLVEVGRAGPILERVLMPVFRSHRDSFVVFRRDSGGQIAQR